MISKECGICEWFVPPGLLDYEVGLGRCHRFPPTPVLFRSGIGSVHAEVSRVDWCGEWQPKKSQEPPK